MLKRVQLCITKKSHIVKAFIFQIVTFSQDLSQVEDQSLSEKKSNSHVIYHVIRDVPRYYHLSVKNKGKFQKS